MNEQNSKAFKANSVTKASKLNSQKDSVANSGGGGGGGSGGGSGGGGGGGRKGEKAGGSKPNNAATALFTINNKDEVISR